MDIPASNAVGLAVSVQNVVRRFGNRTIIDHLNLDIRRGEFVALLGTSGCGKSTLLRILAGLDREIEGDVFVSRRRGVAFQSPRLFPWKRVWSNVVAGLPVGGRKARAESALAEVDLAHRRDAWPKDLSGGEAQRASLARALVRNPDLLLLDEPFGALDALTRLKAQALVADLWQKHRQAVLLVTHDVEEALLLADRVLVMRDGIVAYEAMIDLPRPRSAGGIEFDRLRLQLLAWLGVVEPAVDKPDAGDASASKVKLVTHVHFGQATIQGASYDQNQ